MYIGIDLGTTNSAIAGYNNGNPRIFKTSGTDSDIMPSAIYMDERGHVFVGDRAKKHVANSPDDVAVNFKRQLGTTSVRKFRKAGKSLTVEECSSLIIKELLGQARENGCDEFTGAVITIPASFTQTQMEATNRAAGLAGLDKIALLQEPIAAAMAVLRQTKNNNSQFLVYDLGGGTFDLALIQCVDGNFNIINHEGNNLLGGCDFDRLILTELVYPNLRKEFNLPIKLSGDKYEKLERKLMDRIEEAKKELSSKEETVIYADTDDLQTEDEDGHEISLCLDISRNDYEPLIKEKVMETVKLARKVINDSGYSSNDIENIVFVGGPTKTPYIREIVSQEIGIPAEMSIDPMTAVAIGAALFCESRDWSGLEVSGKSTRTQSKTTGIAEIQIDASTRVTKDEAQIRLSPSKSTATACFEIQVDSTTGWTSGRKKLIDVITITVPVDKIGENKFRILVFDSFGKLVSGTTKDIVVTRSAASVTAIPAMQSSAVLIREGENEDIENILETIIEKGTPLPAHGISGFRAARDIKGDGDFV